MPLLSLPRAQPPPCYRAWTTLVRNMTVEDNLVLPSLPYFGENDTSDAVFFKERGFEVAGDTESMMIDPLRRCVILLVGARVLGERGAGFAMKIDIAYAHTHAPPNTSPPQMKQDEWACDCCAATRPSSLCRR
jgi:hypothetical protein